MRLNTNSGHIGVGSLPRSAATLQYTWTLHALKSLYMAIILCAAYALTSSWKLRPLHVATQAFRAKRLVGVWLLMPWHCVGFSVALGACERALIGPPTRIPRKLQYDLRAVEKARHD